MMTIILLLLTNFTRAQADRQSMFTPCYASAPPPSSSLLLALCECALYNNYISRSSGGELKDPSSCYARSLGGKERKKERKKEGKKERKKEKTFALSSDSSRPCEPRAAPRTPGGRRTRAPRERRAGKSGRKEKRKRRQLISSHRAADGDAAVAVQRGAAGGDEGAGEEEESALVGT